jgi:hypothetical protein
MKSRVLHSSANDALPPAVFGRTARLALAGLLALGILTLVLTCLRNDAHAFIPGEDRTAQVIAVNDVPRSSAQATSTVYLAFIGRVYDADSYPNCRFGVGERYHPVVSYNVSALNVGWFVNWKTQTSPPRPGGAEYVQMLHVSGSTYSPSGPTLAARIAANPGALWLIGNEPDCIHQDNVLPQEYAQAYHDAYAFIKANDPTARVSAGGIVQPTPLRMQYLDIVLDTYVSLYGEPLPTDAWNIHTYILREKRGDYGCDIPPGISADEGEPYNWWDSDRLDIFQARILAFRHWMNEHGYRETPLYITEYGTLLPYYDFVYEHEGVIFDEARARDFMVNSFDFLLTATDLNVGYPADENRLVQRWLWYSLDDTLEYGGALFDPLTLDMMQLGADFGAYTGAMTPTADLFAVDVGQTAPISSSADGAVTITLRARVSNVGNVAIAQPVTVRFLDGEGHQIGLDQVITATVSGCAEVRSITTTWPGVTTGSHVVRVMVDPEDDVSEGSEGNNEVSGVVLVAKE